MLYYLVLGQTQLLTNPEHCLVTVQHCTEQHNLQRQVTPQPYVAVGVRNRVSFWCRPMFGKGRNTVNQSSPV